MKRLLACILIIAVVFAGCVKSEPQTIFDGVQIKLTDSKITVDGEEITTDNAQSVYVSNDIVYYPEGKDFTFGAGTAEDEHEKSEADGHKVINITKAGTYVFSGTVSAGQIAVDLGDDAKDDPNAVVTLILNGVNVTCTVAPAIIFYNVYECGSDDTETATKDVDTSKAGANIIIADNTENNVKGSYVAKIYKSYELSEDGTEVIDAKKLHKYDGAVYSKCSMNVSGSDTGNGILNIIAENEGLDSELHLTINSGVINITSGNDGINTNEDNVSVTTINGGTVNITCDGSTGEGDGIDSNGWLVINGGTVTSYSCSSSEDSGLDADLGIYINGGSIIATGNMFDRIADSGQTYAVFSFKTKQEKSGVYKLKNSDNTVVSEYKTENEFKYLLISDSTLTDGDYTFWKNETQLSAVKMSMGDMNNGKPEMPNGEVPQKPDGEAPEIPDGQVPQMPNGEATEMPDGQAPQKPSGEVPEMPDGQAPQMPNSTPDGNAEIVSTFTIAQGENMFMNVTPYEA